MGGVGDEVAPHRLLALEAGGHLVERIGEAGELLGSVARDPRRVVAVGDPAGRRADLGERPREHPGQDDRQGDAGHDRHHDRGDDHGRDRLVVHRLGVVGRLMPASTISVRKTSAPTTVTPTARIASPTAAEARAASAIRVAMPAPDHQRAAR